MSSSYIISAVRTPLGRLMGSLSSQPAPRLGAVAVREALARSRQSGERVDEVVLGQVLQAGVGQAPARQAALQAGVPAAVPSLTVNKVCGSGLKAVLLADQAIRCGDAELVVAGGMESMSRAPHLLLNARRGCRYGDQPLRDSMILDGLWCTAEQVSMGDLADALAQRHGIGRAAQDAFAARSHQLAVAARQRGATSAEMVSVTVESPSGPVLVQQDEGPREGVTGESLGQLAPAFSASGTVTAGNASQISDGAAALVVASESLAESSDVPWRARIVAGAASGVEPRDLYLAPISAIRRVLARADWSLGDVELIELNEAFAVQSLACQTELDLDAERLNVRGGSIALGHPIGASGARILVTLLHALVEHGMRRGLAAACLGGGNAVALLVELERRNGD